MTLKDFGERVKQKRLDLGMSQLELAQKIGYKDKSTIAKIESGDRDLPRSKIVEIATALNVTPQFLLGWNSAEKKKERHLVPVYGRIQAGIPIEAIQDILDYEEINEEMARNGEYLGLRVSGSSMEPKISEGDVVIIRCQSAVENGQIAAVLVNGSDATLKKFYRYGDKVTLVSLNPSFPDMEIDLKETPVSILGRLVELRAKF